MEAENYLAGGYGIKLAIEARKSGWQPLGEIANVWQPSRLKGIQVTAEFGTPFFAATQVFDIRPTPRKFLSAARTDDVARRFVNDGQIVVTCSGNVGRTTLAYTPHRNILISHDLLRVEPKNQTHHGWIYAYLRASSTHGMMTAAKYGHIIKHLEVGHLNSLPVPAIAPSLLDQFNHATQEVLSLRNRAYALLIEAEMLYENRIGLTGIKLDSKLGFSTALSELTNSRRRFEAAYHLPIVNTILERFSALHLKIDKLAALVERDWIVTRNKTIFGSTGVDYMSADEIFSLNAVSTKKVLVDQIKNASQLFVKAGWLVMACSGQTYGLNGSVMLMTKRHERYFFSQDLIRLIPDSSKVRAGYLLIALGHPKIGRPLVIRYAYGTSIPHIDPVDVGSLPVVRLEKELEEVIANKAEEAIALYAEADEKENKMASDADIVINNFMTVGR